MKNELILLAILFLGLFLRIYDLGNESIWVDEGISIRLAHLKPFQIIEDRASNIHPPLYFVILHYWVNLFGDSEFSTRFLSVIFGLLTIFMICKVGGLVFDKEVGILSSLLLGLSVFHIHYSQETRSYSLMALLTLLSIYFFVKLLEKRSLVVAIGYILSSILLMYTHLFGLFIIVAQNIYLVTLFLLSSEVYKLGFKRWILLQGILIVLFIPWIRILISQVLVVQSGFWIPAPSIRSIIASFLEYSGSVLLLPCFLILSSFSMITYEKTRGNIAWKDFFESIESYSWNVSLSNINKIYLLLVWLFIPIIFPFVISHFSAPIYITKATISASLAFYLLVAKGISNINYKYKFVIASIIVAFSLLNIWKYYTEVNKEQWRDVANYIDTNAEHGDLLLFNAGFCQENAFDYYSERTDLIKKPFPEKTRDVFYFSTVDEEDVKELMPTVDGYNRVWVILSHSRDHNGLIEKTLRESYNLSYHKKYVVSTEIYQKYVGVEVYLFEKMNKDLTSKRENGIALERRLVAGSGGRMKRTSVSSK
ncbi:MAG: glycosyltransferase family 39 protein [Candidatus Hodarchaeota archaeon]